MTNRFTLAAAGFFLYSVMALAQSAPVVPPVPVKATQVYDITASTVLDCGGNPLACIDNRSAALRHNNLHSYRASGIGTWSVDMQWADVTPDVWTSYGSTAQVSNVSPASGIGYGVDPATDPTTGQNYHDFIRFIITGSATIENYVGLRDIWSLPSVGSISFPVTGNQGGTSGLFYPDVFAASITQACTNAAMANETVLVTQVWPPLTTQTLACNLWFVSGGMIEPAAPVMGVQQVVTITGSVVCPAGQACLNSTSLGGPGSITLAGSSTPLDSSWLGAACNGVHDDTAAIQSAVQALPPAGFNPQSLPLYTGAIKIPGQKVATGIGCVISSTINVSTYVTVAGVNPESTRISAAPNFNNSAGSETFAFNTTSLEGTGGNPNGDFGSIFRDFQLNTINTGNALVSCFNWPVSLHSVIDNVACGTSNRGFVIGGALQTVASADNVTMRNVEAGLAAVVGGPCPQGYIFPFFGSNGSTNAINVDNWKVQGLANGNGGGFTYPCAEVPVVYIGNGDAGITMNNGNCESCPSFITIGPGSGNIHINSVAVGGACGANFTAMNRIALVDPDDTGIYINGYSICMPTGIVLGHIPQLSTPYPLNYQLVDANNNVQQVTTAGTSGATQLTRSQWQTSGTTTWGGAVFTYQSPIASTCKGLVLQINCQAEPAASSSSDSNYHFFDFKLGVADHFGSDNFYGTNAFYGPLTWFPLTPSSNPGSMSINPDAKSVTGTLGATALASACQTGLLLGASSLASPRISLFQDTCAGGSPYLYFTMEQLPGGLATSYPIDWKKNQISEGSNYVQGSMIVQGGLNIGTDSGADNAIVVTMNTAGSQVVPLAANKCFTVILGNTLRAGPNTLNYNNLVVAAIKSSRNPANDIATPWAVGGYLPVCYNSAVFLDMTQ